MCLGRSGCGGTGIFFGWSVDGAGRQPAGVEGAGEAERVVDYLAGMTDRFCIREFEALTVPRSFA